MSDPTEAAIKAQGEALSNAFDDASVIAQKLAEWVAKNYPDKVATAYWVTVEKVPEHDKGFQINVMALPWTWAQKFKASVGLLIGAGTVGANLNALLWQDESKKWSALAGIGAVSAYSELKNGGKWVPVVSFAVRASF